MKKSKFYLMSGFLGLVATTLLVSSMASADTGLFQGRNFNANRNFDSARYEEMQAQHDVMMEVLENRDYDGWLEIINSRPQITDYINQNNFDKFVDTHNYMQEGDLESAQVIHDELGLPDGLGGGFGPGKGVHRGHNMGMGNFRAQSLEE